MSCWSAGVTPQWTSRERECQHVNIAVRVPPIDSPTDDEHADVWLHEAKDTLLETKRLMIGLGQRRDDCQQPHVLVTQLAAWIARLLDETNVTRLLVEGGATASALVRYLGWSRLNVVAVPAAGVVELDVLENKDAPRLVVKPGSYAWPAEVQQQFFSIPETEGIDNE